MSGQESALRVLLVAFGVALFCALLVSSAVYWLRPMQAAHRSLDQNRAVLVAAGFAGPSQALSDDEIISRFAAVQTELVELDTRRVVETDPVIAGLYDYRAAIDDPERTVAIPQAQDIADLGRRPRVMPLYRLRGNEEHSTSVVVPVYGRGMWSTIHGFVGLAGDLETVTGVIFYEQGETAGIGDRIERPEWLATWAGKRVYREDGSVGLRIAPDTSDVPAAERIDSITGATVTSTAVGRFVRYWFGPHAWGPILDELRSKGI
jgi:Na+-transporting NADH:ubiquinone oxidoreductase subunit C